MTMEDEGEKKELVIITGMSGAGKSETMNFLRTGNISVLTIFR